MIPDYFLNILFSAMVGLFAYCGAVPYALYLIIARVICNYFRA